MRWLPENSATKRSGSGCPAKESAASRRPRGPTLGPTMQQGHPPATAQRPKQREARGLPARESQVCHPDFGQFACQAQLVQVQRQVVAGCQDGMSPLGEVRQQTGELAESLRTVQVVEILDDQREITVDGGELRESGRPSRLR